MHFPENTGRDRTGNHKPKDSERRSVGWKFPRGAADAATPEESRSNKERGKLPGNFSAGEQNGVRVDEKSGRGTRSTLYI